MVGPGREKGSEIDAIRPELFDVSKISSYSFEVSTENFYASEFALGTR